MDENAGQSELNKRKILTRKKAIVVFIIMLFLILLFVPVNEIFQIESGNTTFNYGLKFVPIIEVGIHAGETTSKYFDNTLHGYYLRSIRIPIFLAELSIYFALLFIYIVRTNNMLAAKSKRLQSISARKKIVVIFMLLFSLSIIFLPANVKYKGALQEAEGLKYVLVYQLGDYEIYKDNIFGRSIHLGTAHSELNMPIFLAEIAIMLVIFSGSMYLVGSNRE